MGEMAIKNILIREGLTEKGTREWGFIEGEGNKQISGERGPWGQHPGASVEQKGGQGSLHSELVRHGWE